MPWMERSRMSVRQEFCTFAADPAWSVSARCRRFGISRKSAYKWLGRYAGEGVDGLADRPRRPATSPTQTAPEVVAAVLALRAATGWGGRKLHHALRQQGMAPVPAPSPITTILARHGAGSAAALAAAPIRWQRFEAAGPNALGQMDFTGPVALAQGTCSPLLVLDDHSRFLVGLTVSPDQQRGTVQAALTTLFGRYGLPWRMLVDNGSPWGTSHHGVGVPLTRLTAWLIRLGITISHSRPDHPQTQGKIERCNRTLGAELLSRRAPTDPVTLQQQFDRWRDRYNLHRPHAALAHQPPITRYCPSPRPFPTTLPPLRYEPDDHLARVSAQGFIRLARKRYFISQVIPGDPVAVRPTTEAAIMAIWYGPQFVTFIDLREPS